MHDEPRFSTDFSAGEPISVTPDRALRKRRRPGRLWRLGTVLSGLMSFAIVVVVGIVAGVYFLKQHLKEPGPLTRQKTVVIAPGSGLSAIARILGREGVIDNVELFVIGASIDRAQTRMRAGEYLFEPGISMNSVMVKLITGDSVKHKVTLPEGLTSYQIVERLNANTVLIGEIAAVPAEGTLLPETYVFQRGRKRIDVINDMRKAQRVMLDGLWEKRAGDLPYKTKAEAVILASIVEKETGIAAERPRVAAVFINRLRRKVRLQSDPTIIYGITGGKGPLGRAILKSEINAKTPYNTYQIDGLPPSPIANPGKDSLAAVLNPIATEDMFFVADGTGGHVFARTLSAHRKNVVKWRKIEAERRKAATKKPGNGDAAPPGSKPAAGKNGAKK